MLLGLLDACAALANLSIEGRGEGFIAASFMSPISRFLGARNGAVIGAPAFAIGAATIGGLASVYRNETGALGRASTWNYGRLALALSGFAGALIWVLKHPTLLFGWWS